MRHAQDTQKGYVHMLDLGRRKGETHHPLSWGSSKHNKNNWCWVNPLPGER